MKYLMCAIAVSFAPLAVQAQYVINNPSVQQQNMYAEQRRMQQQQFQMQQQQQQQQRQIQQMQMQQQQQQMQNLYTPRY